MLPASNRGVGMNIGFPDVCLTPMVPSPVPIPYPNMALNAQAAPFVLKVMVRMMNMLNMGSKIPMTTGDEGGVSHPLFKQMGAYTMGNPRILMECLPAISLLMPTTGNMMNNPAGVVAVPSVVHLFLSLRETEVAADDDRVQSATTEKSVGPAALTKRSDLSVHALNDDVYRFAVPLIGRDLPARVHTAVRAMASPPAAIILDLRGNPGGELHAAVALVDDFLEHGAHIATLVDGDGDETHFRARNTAAYSQPVVVLVDEGTASAAELLAASLQRNGRAIVIGNHTYGKTAVQTAARMDAQSRIEYAPCATWRVAEHAQELAANVTPDVLVSLSQKAVRGDVENDEPLQAALLAVSPAGG